MKRLSLLFCFSLIFSTFLMTTPIVTDSMAFGLGAFYSYGSGDSDVDIDDDYSTKEEFDDERTGFGFVLDTTVATDRLFNYRLNIGYKQVDLEYHNCELDLSGISIENTFGFGVFRNKALRIWLGPQINLSYLTGDGNWGQADVDDVWTVGCGLGVVSGINIHAGPVVSICFDLGWRYNMNWGQMDYSYYDYYYGHYYYESDTCDVTIDGHEIFATISILFRIGGDTY